MTIWPARVVAAPAPSAIEFVKPAAAPWPSAVAEPPLASAPSPKAESSFCNASASEPTAVVLPLAAWPPASAAWPSAVEFEPVALEAAPTAEALLPVAWAPGSPLAASCDPTAVESLPLAVAPSPHSNVPSGVGCAQLMVAALAPRPRSAPPQLGSRQPRAPMETLRPAAPAATCGDACSLAWTSLPPGLQRGLSQADCGASHPTWGGCRWRFWVRRRARQAANRLRVASAAGRTQQRASQSAIRGYGVRSSLREREGESTAATLRSATVKASPSSQSRSASARSSVASAAAITGAACDAAAARRSASSASPMIHGSSWPCAQRLQRQACASPWSVDG